MAEKELHRDSEGNTVVDGYYASLQEQGMEKVDAYFEQVNETHVRVMPSNSVALRAFARAMAALISPLCLAKKESEALLDLVRSETEKELNRLFGVEEEEEKYVA